MAGKPFQVYKIALIHLLLLARGTHAALCSGDKSVRVCDVKTGKTITGPFRGHLQGFMYKVNSVSFSHDNKHILSCSDDGMIRIWDSEAGESVQDPFQGHTAGVQCVTLSNNGGWIVSGSSNRMDHIWEMSTGRMVGWPLEECERSV